MNDPALALRTLFDTAVAAAQPARVLGAHLPPPPRGRTLVLGLGKAAVSMGAALEAAWPDTAPLEGVLVAPAGSAPTGLRRLRLLHGRHPVPDAGSEAGALALLQAAATPLGADDQVLILLSGGASALATAPLPGLTLEDLRAINQALLASGAPIDAMNTVRKHLCALKGGRLGAACAPDVPVLTLAISDIPGDALDLIGSGPPLPDPTTCDDALALCARWGIALPSAALAGLRSRAFETPKHLPAHHQARLIASPALALQAAAAQALSWGWQVHLGRDDLQGEARVLGAALAQEALAATPSRPTLWLSGGEATVTLKHPQPGVGGRAVETLLATALAAAETGDLHALMADTDGLDGTGPHAGARLAPDSLARARALGLDATEHLARHDAGGFFARLGDTLLTGATGTNVNDFRALLRLPAAR